MPGLFFFFFQGGKEVFGSGEKYFLEVHVHMQPNGRDFRYIMPSLLPNNSGDEYSIERPDKKKQRTTNFEIVTCDFFYFFYFPTGDEYFVQRIGRDGCAVQSASSLRRGEFSTFSDSRYIFQPRHAVVQLCSDSAGVSRDRKSVV